MHTATPTIRSRQVPTLRAALGALASLLLTATVLLWSGTAAQAHDHLVDSTPTAEEQLPEAPTKVRLEFSAQILELGTEVRVVDADGASWEAGAPEVDGTQVTVRLEAGMTAGDYEVRWRVTSSDGHPISGLIPFTVEAGDEPADPPAASPSPTDSVTDDADPSSAPTSEDPATDEAEPTSGAATSDAAQTPGATEEGGSPEAGEADSTGLSGGALALGALAIAVAVGALAVVLRRRGSPTP